MRGHKLPITRVPAGCVRVSVEVLDGFRLFLRVLGYSVRGSDVFNGIYIPLNLTPQGEEFWFGPSVEWYTWLHQNDADSFLGCGYG